MELEKALKTALEAADSASEILLSYFGKKQEISEKAENDFVTEADKESEKVILKTITSSFPEHEIVAEESGVKHGKGWRWFVDPLDGTKNFIHGLPIFAVSIGLERDDELVLGVVKVPFLSQTFWAVKGQGAFLNGQRIHVSDRPYEKAFVATGFPFRGKHLIDVYLKCFRQVFTSVSAVRRCGAAAVDLAYTACGIFDGFFEIGLHSWDVAAGAVLIREAGGVVTDFEADERGFLETGNIIGASAKAYEKLFSYVNRHLKGVRV